MPRSVRRARRRRAMASGERPLLQRILDMPQLPEIVPRLAPEVLHRFVQSCGLEDCGELVALATPAQLARVFDLDLWRARHSGRDEEFDADRFGKWLEVLLECGADVAAQKLVGIDADLVIAGFAEHIAVFDRAAVSRDAACEIGSYLVESRRTGSWDAIVDLLRFLHDEHQDYFRVLMAGCRGLSNSTPEVDGLHDLLTDREQDMFDLALAREERREEQGYVTPAQARAFLQLARQVQLTLDTPPPVNPIAHAYFRAFERTPLQPDADPAPRLLPGSDSPSISSDLADATTAVVDVLREAGVLNTPHRALLLGDQQNQEPRLARIHAHVQAAHEANPNADMKATAEFAFLANTLVAGCSIQGRPFTEREATDAAVAVCNLGLENWPRRWPPAEDLVCVFQVGWTVLHDDVSVYAADRLIDALTACDCGDAELQSSLDALRIDLSRHCRTGAPWRARDALDVIAILDMPAWAALLGLIAECPLMHAGITASSAGTRSVSATAFEFISENSQLATVRHFLQSLPETLRP